MFCPATSIEDEIRATAVRSGTCKPYPAYRPSGVEWLAEVPTHWEVKRLKYAATLNPRVSEVRRLAPDTKVSFVPMETVGEYGGLDLSLTKELADVADGFTYFSDGDVLVAKITPCFENGKGTLAEGLLNGIAFGTTELHIVRCGPELDKRFTFYLTLGNAFRKLGAAEMYGAGGQKRVPESFVADLKHPIPSLAEQRTIAVFLDRETVKIDTLVAKKERLIELLQEKRTALISRAVTKGLDPNVPMKDSGVEWLGEIPEHWKVRRLKLISEIRYGLGQPPRESLDGLPLIRATNVSSGHITDAGMVYIDPLDVPSGRRAFLSEHEIIVVRSGAYTADSSIVPRRYEGSVAGYDMVVTARSVNPQFLATALLCPYVRDAQLVVASTRSAQPHLNAEELGEALILFPPLSEQQSIAGFLGSETPKLDALIVKVRQAIEHLKELRAALISEAVTGGIDVREEAA